MVSPTAMTDCAVPRIDKKAMKASQTRSAYRGYYKFDTFLD
jgi:hypothetical protein